MADSTEKRVSKNGRIEVYTDGQCPLCQWTRSRVEPFDRERRIEWINYRDPEAQHRAARFSFEELDKEMHVRRWDGRWFAGFPAWVEVIRVLPGWRLLAPALSVWPFSRLGPHFYAWLASRRYKLLGIPPPCDASGVCSLHKSKDEG